MLPVGKLDGTCAWMDETEVTRAHYRGFLDFAQAGSPDDVNVPTCSGRNDTFIDPGVDMVESGLPVAGVDWCDAAAYCAWAGKSLCGTYTANGGEWSMLEVVCTDGDHAGFDYVALREAGTCRGGGQESPSEAGSHPGCTTPTGVKDLVGNVAEWTAECESDGPDSSCTVRGGGYGDEGEAWGCSAKRSAPRDFHGEGIGFRCCVDPGSTALGS